jgi:hypothetical protein
VGGRDVLELGELGVAELAGKAQLDLIAEPFEPVDGLADFADRPSPEREGAGVDDRLVGEVEGVQAGTAVEGQHRFARSEGADPQAVAGGEAARLPEQVGDRGGVADGVAGDQEHVALDPVCEEGLPVGAEQVLGVLAELEESERVAAVGADALAPTRVFVVLESPPKLVEFLVGIVRVCGENFHERSPIFYGRPELRLAASVAGVGSGGVDSVAKIACRFVFKPSRKQRRRIDRKRSGGQRWKLDGDEGERQRLSAGPYASCRGPLGSWREAKA